MDRIVDIATDGRHLSVYRGFLIVSEDRAEVGRIPLDDVAAVIVHAHGITWSTNLIVALAQRGAVMLLCGSNHAPVAVSTAGGSSCPEQPDARAVGGGQAIVQAIVAPDHHRQDPLAGGRAGRQWHIRIGV